jgi:hypothetical protein
VERVDKRNKFQSLKREGVAPSPSGEMEAQLSPGARLRCSSPGAMEPMSGGTLAVGSPLSSPTSFGHGLHMASDRGEEGSTPSSPTPSS